MEKEWRVPVAHNNIGRAFDRGKRAMYVEDARWNGRQKRRFSYCPPPTPTARARSPT